MEKFDLNENPPTVATDNTLPIGILIKHVKDFYVFGERITTETLKQYQEAIVEAMQEYSSTQRQQARNEAIQLIEMCEKTFGKINEIFETLKSNTDHEALVKLIEAIDIDIPLIQATIKDELEKLKR